MTENKLINTQVEQYKTVIDDLFQELHQLVLKTKNKELTTTVDNIRARLHEPFLFVIVGEVKVGKSSFINALLQTGTEVCKVAPDPCTDTIQQIVYGTENTEIMISEHLKKITLPVPILQKIAIVDTPGTNTIAEHHQEITEKFIPISDLVIFVFEAKNPYRQSAWDLLNYVSQAWKKKVVFVLQQVDLMEPADLEINKNGVLQYAQKKGIENPTIFLVSAKKELQGDLQNSGFEPVRDFINNSITGINNARLKLQSLLQTATQILKNIQNGIDNRQKQLEIDSAFRHKINLLLNQAELKSNRHADELLNDILTSYDSITQSISFDFENGLGVFTLLKKSFLSIFDKSQSMEQWLPTITQRFETELRPAVDKKIREAVGAIAESVKQLAEIIDAEIRQNEAILKSNHQIFGDIAEKRHDKLEKLQSNFEQIVYETEQYMTNEVSQQSSTLMPNMAVGSALTALGVILMGVTHTVALDITGGILSVAGISVAGIATALKKQKIINEFKTEIEKGRNRLKQQIEEKLKTYTKEINTKIDNNFLEFDTFINEEKSNLQNIANEHSSISTNLKKVATELEINLQ